MRLPDPSSADNSRGWLVAAALLGGVILGAALGWRFLGPRSAATATPPLPVATTAAQPGAFTTLAPGGPTPDAGLGAAPVAGRPAPDFTLATLDGGQVTLSDLRGRTVLINFWASWCPPCRLEMPDLVRAYEEHKDEGFIILGVDLTFQDALPDVRAFVEEFKMSFPVLLDETGEVTTQKYRLLGLPMSVFIDREGTIRRTHIGAMTSEQIDEFVGEILEE